MTRLKFGLTDNALDYLLTAAEHAHQDTSRDAKYALLHLATGIELLLKARLSQDHWSLLFANTDTATKQALESGDFVSVDAGLAIKRLCNISGCKIADDDLKHLRSLREHRNRVQHFAIDVERAAVISLITRSFDFSIRFIREQMEAVLDEHGREQVGEVLRALSNFKNFVDARLQAAAGALVKAKKVVDCPVCDQETLELGGGNPKCHFCGYSDAVRAVAERSYHELEPVRCPVCNVDGAMVCTYFEVSSRWRCFSCGAAGEFDFCENQTCRNLVTNSGTDGYCSECASKQSAEANSR